jgi:hypothetical protein
MTYSIVKIDAVKNKTEASSVVGAGKLCMKPQQFRDLSSFAQCLFS